MRVSLKVVQIIILVFLFQSLALSQPSSYAVNGYVYKDNNCNGVRDGGDQLLRNHVVTLEGTTTTGVYNSSGAFQFILSESENVLVASPLTGYSYNNPSDGRLTIPLPPPNFNNNNFGFCLNQIDCDPVEVVILQVVVESGDVYIEGSCNGVILRAPNGSCYRVIIDNNGDYATEAVTCP